MRGDSILRSLMLIAVFTCLMTGLYVKRTLELRDAQVEVIRLQGLTKALGQMLADVPEIQPAVCPEPVQVPQVAPQVAQAKPDVGHDTPIFENYFRR